MEEGPKRRAVEEQIRPAVDVQREPHPARLIAAGAPREIRVAVPGVGGPGRGGVLPGAGALPVCRFGLLEARVDVLRVVEVVVVEGVVFERGAGEPGRLRGFDEEAAARGDVLVAAALEGVVGGPAPHVFDVGG